ncbi:MAG: hypothetical protein QOH64_3302 [Acidimicrobiaceae bacterium]
MLTTGSKYFFFLGTLAAVGAAVYGLGSRGGLNGVLTLGQGGGVGDHVGVMVLVMTGAVAFFVGGALLAFRDADAEAVQQLAGAEHVPQVEAPQGARYWPAIGAVAAAVVAVGLVTGSLLVLLGLIVALVVLLEWMISSWADRATGDHETNRRIRNRLMYPIEIPVFGAIGIVVLVLCVSRVLLALSSNAASAAAIGFASLVLVAAFVIAASPKAARTIVAVVIALGSIGVIAGGIIGAAEGSRTFEKHTEEPKSNPADRRQQQPSSQAPESSPAPTESSATN